jgi:prepilin-type N-terminal cleavage/methylation domain-containing protein
LLYPGGMRNPTEDRGFSLIETLIACALLATALLSIGHLSTAAIVLLMDSRGRTEATLLALSKIEELRSSAAPAAGADTVDAAGQPAGTDAPRVFDRRWSVAPVSPGASILTVIVAPIPSAGGREVRLAGGWTVTP